MQNNSGGFIVELRKYLLTGGLLSVLVLGACGGEDEGNGLEDGPEEPSEDEEMDDSMDDGMDDTDDDMDDDGS